MTVKTIKKGKKRKTKCPICEAILQFTAKDITQVQINDFTGYIELESRITCPECKSILTI